MKNQIDRIIDKYQGLVEANRNEIISLPNNADKAVRELQLNSFNLAYNQFISDLSKLESVKNQIDRQKMVAYLEERVNHANKLVAHREYNVLASIINKINSGEFDCEAKTCSKRGC